MTPAEVAWESRRVENWRRRAVLLRVVAGGYDTSDLVAYGTGRTEAAARFALVLAARRGLLDRWRDGEGPGETRRWHYALTPRGLARLAWYTERGL